MARTVTTMTRAAGTATFTKNVLANDTIIVGDQTYKWVATPGAANDLDLGSDLETSLDNLTLAVNGTGTPGATTYYTGTLQPGDITASNSATVSTFTADTPGTHGNNYILTEDTDSGAAYSITAAFTGGAGDLQTFLDGILSVNQVNSELHAELAILTLTVD